MKNFKVNIKKIKKNIELKTNFWVNKEYTNCYAYALGLDVKEDELIPDAYGLGVFFSEKEGFDKRLLPYFSKEARFLKDLKVLKIKSKKVPYNDKIRDNEKYVYNLISILESGTGSDFHFLRKSMEDGTWWHKRGWHEAPTNKDDLGNIITNPQEAVIGNYFYLNTYKLKLKRKEIRRLEC